MPCLRGLRPTPYLRKLSQKSEVDAARESIKPASPECCFACIGTSCCIIACQRHSQCCFHLSVRKFCSEAFEASNPRTCTLHVRSSYFLVRELPKAQTPENRPSRGMGSWGSFSSAARVERYMPGAQKPVNPKRVRTLCPKPESQSRGRAGVEAEGLSCRAEVRSS